MNVQVLQEDLLKALSTSSKFCSSHAQLPILSNLLLQTVNNKLMIKATNLEMSICYPIGAKTEQDGDITIPARPLFEMVTNMNKGSMTIKALKEQINVSSGNFSANLLGMNSADFPSIPQKLTGEIIKINKDVFSLCLKKVLFAVSVDETRPTLTGVLMVFNKDEIGFIATDGYRLSYKKLKIDYKGKPIRIIIPKNVLNEIQKLETSVDLLEISTDQNNNQVVFSLGGIVLSSRLIEGEFPDFEKIIPKKSAYFADLDLIEFQNSVKLASVFSRESSNTLKLVVKKERLKILSENQKYGNQENEIEAKVKFDGEETDLTIAFNYKFILDFLGCCDGDDVALEFNDQNAPGKFIDPSDKDFLHLIMPVKI